MTLFRKNVGLLLIVLFLLAAPLMVGSNNDFRGTDQLANDVVRELQPGFKPWHTLSVSLAGGEMESMLFALQAAIGAGFIGYYFGYIKGKKAGRG